MNKLKTLAVTILPALILTACSSSTAATQAALDFRAGLLESGGCTAVGTVCTQVYGTEREYMLSAEHSGDSCRVTVIEPEEISGVSALASSFGGEAEITLDFDGLYLEAGSLSQPELTPIGCIPAFIDAWGSGYIDSVCLEEADGRQLLLVSILVGYGSSQLEYRTWLETDGLTPVCGELFSGGSRISRLDIEEFALST